MKRLAIAVVLLLVAALAPAGAEAKAHRIRSFIDLDVVGGIDRHGSVQYAFTGAVGTPGLTFRCQAKRQVTLFRVEANGTAAPVASDRTDFLGGFLGPLERPLNEIAGYYYATAPQTKVKGKQGKLVCLAARSPTILVEVPAGLL